MTDDRITPHVDMAHLAEERRLTMAARLERASAWMRFNAALHGAARDAEVDGPTDGDPSNSPPAP